MFSNIVFFIKPVIKQCITQLRVENSIYTSARMLTVGFPFQGRIRLGIRKRFFTGGQWECNRLPKAGVMRLSCQSSRNLWTVPSDIGFDLEWTLVEPGVGLTLIHVGSLPAQDIFCDSMTSIKSLCSWSLLRIIELEEALTQPMTGKQTVFTVWELVQIIE